MAHIVAHYSPLTFLILFVNIPSTYSHHLEDPWQPLSTVPFFCHCCWSVTKSCPTLCDPMDCSTPGSSVLQYLQEFAQTHVRWVGDTILPSSVVPLSSCLQSFSGSGSFPKSQLLESGGQRIGASASTPVLPYFTWIAPTHPSCLHQMAIPWSTPSLILPWSPISSHIFPL